MAYTYLDPTVPDGLTQTGPEVTPSVRANQNALIDGITMGTLVRWNMQVTAGSAAQPTEVTYFHESRVDRLRETITWDANDNPEKIFYERSYDDGMTWEEIGTKNIAWSPEGAATAVSWSTPESQSGSSVVITPLQLVRGRRATRPAAAVPAASSLTPGG